MEVIPNEKKDHMLISKLVACSLGIHSVWLFKLGQGQ